MKIRRAFVSHGSADDRFVAEMESFLRASGFDEVFNDVSSIKPDEQFWPRIEQGITDCDTVYIVITAASNNSEWVNREVALARRLGKRVIPVWRDDCSLPSDFADRDVITSDHAQVENVDLTFPVFLNTPPRNSSGEKTQGIAALLKGLATASHGLCVITTRYSLPNLKVFWQTTASEKPLLCLSKPSATSRLAVPHSTDLL